MNLYKSFSFYTIGSIIEKGISFFLLPTFTFYLTTKDFGILTLITSIQGFMVPIISLGVNGAISVAYFNRDKVSYGSYFTASMFSPFVLTIFISLLSYLFKASIEKYFEIPFIWLFITPIYCFLSFFNSMLLNDFQIKNEPSSYIIFSLTNTITIFFVSLLLIYSLNLGFEARLLGQYFSVAFFSIIAFYLMLHKRKLVVSYINWEYVKDSLSFGLPLVPHLIGGLIINLSDRLFIDYYCGKDQLGIYNIGYVIGSIISIFSASFVNAITPFSFKSFAESTIDSLAKVVKIYWIYIFFMITIVLGIYFITPYLFKFLIDKKFYDGRKYVIWITLGYFFQSIYFLFVNSIFFLKKTKILLYFSVINVLLNLSLNYILIPSYGPIGAAYATFLSFLVFCIFIAIYSNSILPLPWFSLKIIKK